MTFILPILEYSCTSYFTHRFDLLKWLLPLFIFVTNNGNNHFILSDNYEFNYKSNLTLSPLIFGIPLFLKVLPPIFINARIAIIEGTLYVNHLFEVSHD